MTLFAHATFLLYILFLNLKKYKTPAFFPSEYAQLSFCDLLREAGTSGVILDEGSLPAIAVDIAKRVIVSALTGSNDLQTSRYFPHVPALGSVPYTAILGKADQSAVLVEDETTVIISRDMYNAYSQLGEEARTLESTRRQAEDSATARQNNQQRAELYRPHRTTAEKRSTSARRSRRGK